MRAAARGFTLIEVLLATSLLAAALAIAFATLRAATATVDRGEAMAQRNTLMRATEGFLRARLAGARNLAFGTDPATELPMRFLGEPNRMQFVADLPDYLGRGGPYLHTIAIVRDGDSQRVTVDLALVQGGEAMPEADPRPPDVLAEGLREARFRYRGLDEQGVLGEWQDSWPTSDMLPLQVEVDLADRRGPWPPLVVALPLATGGQQGPFGAGRLQLGGRR